MTDDQIKAWAERAKASGLSGNVQIIGNDGIKIVNVDDPDAANHTKIPRDVVPYLHELLKYRDRLLKDALKNTMEIAPEAVDLYSLRASCLQLAIDFIRDKYKGNSNDRDSSTEASGPSAEVDEAAAGSGSTDGEG